MAKKMLVYEDRYGARHVEFPTPGPQDVDKLARSLGRGARKGELAKRCALLEIKIRVMLESRFSTIDCADDIGDEDTYPILRMLGYDVEFEDGAPKVEKRDGV